MYTHITNARITEIKNAPSREQTRTVAKTDKPAGLWYARDNEWRGHFYKDKLPLWKYTLHLTEDDFTDDYKTPAPTKILRVNMANFADVVANYGKEYLYSNVEILEKLIYDRIKDRDDTLDFLVGEDTDSDYNNSNNEIDELNKKLIKTIRDYETNSDGTKIDETFAGDVISEIDGEYGDKPPYDDFNWPEFWRKLSENFAGIEFATDLLDIVEIPSPVPDIRPVISTSFMPFIEIRSGVIFKPATFFAARKADWVEEEIKEGGGRRRLKRTRKHKRHHRKTKKGKSHKK
jgi:hypothetical protein